jgi:FkbM family methyltransferase
LKKNPLKPLFVPAPYRWEDFCQTTDEILNPVNWHNFLSPDFSLTREDLVIDCGAAEGLFSWFADYQGSQVLAVEPDAAFAAGLHRTFAGQPSVRVVRAALSHRRGEGRISRRGIFSSLTSHADGDSVAVETVDTLTRGNKVTFLKADVEGHELRVLLGAEETLRQHQPRVAVTVYHDTNNPHEIREFLLACDSRYQFRTKGIYDNGNPVLLQAWVR